MTSVADPSTHIIMAPLVIDQVKHLVILSFISTYSIICYTIVSYSSRVPQLDSRHCRIIRLRANCVPCEVCCLLGLIKQVTTSLNDLVITRACRTNELWTLYPGPEEGGNIQALLKIIFS